MDTIKGKLYTIWTNRGVPIKVELDNLWKEVSNSLDDLANLHIWPANKDIVSLVCVKISAVCIIIVIRLCI